MSLPALGYAWQNLTALTDSRRSFHLLTFVTVNIEDTIQQLESELRAAQLNSDVTTLDRLIDDALLFTGPDGALATKADDLAMHRDCVVQFTSHEPRNLQWISVTDEVVVVALQARLAGRFHEAEFAGDFRYTRVWARRNDAWRVVAGHVSAINDPDAQNDLPREVNGGIS